MVQRKSNHTIMNLVENIIYEFKIAPLVYRGRKEMFPHRVKINCPILSKWKCNRGVIWADIEVKDKIKERINTCFGVR